MKTSILFFLAVFSLGAYASDVYVDGYSKGDGTYVAPHTRSAPDSYKWNNYGKPSASDRQEQQDIHTRDQDNDSIYNQYDYDDDNDGIRDDDE